MGTENEELGVNDIQTPSYIMTYVLNDTPIATRIVRSGDEPHVNDIYLCPTCCNAWAGVFHSGAKNNRPVCYNFITRYCGAHLPMWPQAIAGCFLDPFTYPECYHSIPKEVLIHDFLAHMANRDKLYEKRTHATIPVAQAV